MEGMYSQVGYWIDVYERGDGRDPYGRLLPLMSGNTELKKKGQS